MAATERVTSYTDNEYLKENGRFVELMNRAIDLTTEKRGIDGALKSLNEEIEAELIIAKVPVGKQVDFSDWRIAVVEKKGRSTLDRQALFAEMQKAGLTVDVVVGILKKVSHRGEPSRYVQLTKPGAPKKEKADDYGV